MSTKKPVKPHMSKAQARQHQRILVRALFNEFGHCFNFLSLFQTDEIIQAQEQVVKRYGDISVPYLHTSVCWET